jgi:Family of unknown function (DUF6455)
MGHNEIPRQAIMNPNLTDTSTMFSRAIDWLKAHTVGGDDLGAFSRSDLQVMANDLGVTQADLLDVLPRHEDHSDLMDRMMRDRGLDPDKIRRAVGPLMRDLEITCTRCGAVSRCRRDLAAGQAVEHCHEYCGNAETIDELLATDDFRLKPKS